MEDLQMELRETLLNPQDFDDVETPMPMGMPPASATLQNDSTEDIAPTGLRRWKNVLVSGAGAAEVNGTYCWFRNKNDGSPVYKLFEEHEASDSEDEAETEIFLYRLRLREEFLMSNVNFAWIITEVEWKHNRKDELSALENALYYATNNDIVPPTMGWDAKRAVAASKDDAVMDATGYDPTNPNVLGQGKRPPPYISCPLWESLWVTKVGYERARGRYARQLASKKNCLRYVRCGEGMKCEIRHQKLKGRKVRWILTNGKSGRDEKVWYECVISKRDFKNMGHPPTIGWTLVKEKRQPDHEGGSDDEDPQDRYGIPNSEFYPPPMIQLQEPTFEPELCVSFKVFNDDYHLRLNGDTIDIVPENDVSLGQFYEEHEFIAQNPPDKILRNFKAARVGYVLRISDDGENIFCFVGVEEHVAQRWTDYQDHDLPLEKDNAVIIGREPSNQFLLATRTAANPDNTVDKGCKLPTYLFDQVEDGCCVTVNDDDIPVPGDGWHHVYSQFNLTARPELYSHYIPGTYKQCRVDEPDYDESTIFHPRMKLRVIYELIAGPRSMDETCLPNGAELRVEEFAADPSHPLNGVFPLKDPSLQQQMEEAVTFKNIWNTAKWDEVTLPHIKDYFGEHIGYYFGYIRHLNVSLIPAAIFGTLVFATQMWAGDADIPGLPFISLVVIIWGVNLIESWKRRESVLRMEWGMMRFEGKAVPRPAFHGFSVISNIDGKIEEVQSSEMWYSFKKIFSASTILCCVGCVLATLIGLFIWADNSPKTLEYQIYLGMLNAFQIVVFNLVYYSLSTWLNKFENHRLEDEFEGSYIWKNTTFYCVNSFASLFYIAFLKEGLTDNECLNELMVQLGSLFASSIVIQNTSEYFFLEIYNFITGLCDGGEVEREDISHRELARKKDLIPQSAMDDAAAQMKVFVPTEVRDQMIELITQYGYISFFVVVFPIAPLLALINNCIEIYLDLGVYKKSQRSIPKGSEGLGEWNRVLEAMALISCVTNFALICFRTDAVNRYFGRDDKESQFKLFGVCVTVCIIIVQLIRAISPDVPMKVKEHALRSQAIEKALIFRALMPVQQASGKALTEIMRDERADLKKDSIGGGKYGGLPLT